MAKDRVTNQQIADLLESIAEYLAEREANPFRVRAYRMGARTVRCAEESVAELAERDGTAPLQRLPNIGEGLSAIIREYVQSGHSTLQEQLAAEASPERTLMQVPGIGQTLASHIVQELAIETLPALEAAAHDGRLAAVDGFGPRRVAAVQKSLAGMLSPAAWRRQRAVERRQDQADDANKSEPTVATLLAVDAEYRQRAAADELQRITPRRFNPENKAWLPILHTTRKDNNDGEWRFTALFSNTARAHELQKTDDWVVIYYRPQEIGSGTDENRDDADAEEQSTVVTETQGPLRGRRVVRGREAECRSYYETE
ncbi:MAG TPA: helix-hairpin-helix domain-containing protein [Caldilineaceae bacterium]|nr:helix-hairpin-helix domain-containing protein [Caldilineaceae bacterium]